MIEKIRALFPITGERYRLELARVGEDETLRLLVLEDDGSIRDIKEQTMPWLQAGDARTLQFVMSSLEVARELPFETIELMMPSDLFRFELLRQPGLELDVETLRRLAHDPRARHALYIASLEPPDWSLDALVLDPARRPPPPSLVNATLEAAILERPDDPGAYTVYGDWLAERGDPRGELITVQCALATRPDDPALRARERGILDDHAYELLAELAWRPDLAVTWRYGFPQRVVAGGAWGEQPSMWDAGDVVRACAKQRLLRELVIGGFVAGEDYEWVIDAIAKHGVAPHLTSLGFIVEEHLELGDLEPAYPALAALERLSIEARGAEFGEIVLPALRSFEFLSRGLTASNVEAFRAAAWPNLERLVLCPGMTGVDNCDVTLDDLQWIFDGELPVRHLGLIEVSIEDALERLASSAILPRLSTLDLSGGWMVNPSVVQPYAGKLAHLERLILPRYEGELPGVRAEIDTRYIPVYE